MTIGSEFDISVTHDQTLFLHKFSLLNPTNGVNKNYVHFSAVLFGLYAPCGTQQSKYETVSVH